MTLGRLAKVPGIVVAVTMLASVVSCGSSSDGGSEAAACTGPGVSADQVKVGLVLSDSGPGGAAFASARAGVNARFRLANDAGGVHGRTIQYAWRDDTSSSAESRRVADELVQDESVFGVLPVTMNFDEALVSLETQKVPAVGFAALKTWGNHKNFFSYGYVVDPSAIAQYILKAGGTKVGFVMTGALESALQTAEEYRQAFQRLGLDTTGTISFANGVDSPNQVVSKLMGEGADTIIGFTIPTDLAEIVAAARSQQMGLRASVSLVGYDKSLLQTSGQALAGVSFDVHFTPFESQGTGMTTYRQAMAAYSPEAEAEQQFAMLGYIYADMFVKGLETAGDCPTRESFMTGLRGVHDYNAGGLIGSIDFANNATTPLSCYAFVRVNTAGTAFEVANDQLCADGSAGQ